MEHTDTFNLIFTFFQGVEKFGSRLCTTVSANYSRQLLIKLGSFRVRGRQSRGGIRLYVNWLEEPHRECLVVLTKLQISHLIIKHLHGVLFPLDAQLMLDKPRRYFPLAIATDF